MYVNRFGLLKMLCPHLGVHSILEVKFLLYIYIPTVNIFTRCDYVLQLLSPSVPQFPHVPLENMEDDLKRHFTFDDFILDNKIFLFYFLISILY